MILAVSPHLDDALFSIGAWLATQDDEVVVATVFTASVPDPQGFALACQTDKGIDASVDYLAVRRAEDEAACAVLGPHVRAVHLGLPEAPHRGYEDADALFAGVHPDDAPPVRDALEPWLAQAGIVLGPSAIGEHVDHVLVRKALPPDARLWLDQPYAQRHAITHGQRLKGDVDRKLDACARYATQLGFQFGGEARMRAVLARAPETLTR